MFEYGHALHKLRRYEESNEIFKRALARSADPMIPAVMGKNYEAMGNIDKAMEYYLKAKWRCPSRMYPRYLMMLLQEKRGDVELAHQYASEIMDMAVKVQSPATDDMRHKAREIYMKLK